MLKHFALLFLSAGACSLLNASTLYVQTTGQFASTDVSGPLVIPNDTFSLSFVVNSSTTPLGGSVNSLGFDVPVIDAVYRLNGTVVNATPSEITFSTLANGGLFTVTYGSGLTAEQFSFQGAQIFGGTTSAPTLTTGSYSMTSFAYSDLANYDIQSPASAFVSVTATPEPASLCLMLTALASISAVSFFKKGKSI